MKYKLQHSVIVLVNFYFSNNIDLVTSAHYMGGVWAFLLEDLILDKICRFLLFLCIFMTPDFVIKKNIYIFLNCCCMVNSVSSNYESTQREYKPPIPPAGILRPVEVAFSLSVWIWNCTDAILSSMPIKMKQRRK